MIKAAFLGIFALFIAFITSCGEAGDADVGTTVIVTASADTNYVEQDTVYKQEDKDGNCNLYLIPSIKSVNIDINVNPISKDIANPSPVSVTQIIVKYYPQNNSPVINDNIIGTTLTINPGETGKVSVPVIPSKKLEEFYNQTRLRMSVNYEYYVEVIVKMKEIYFNKDLEKQVRFNLSVKNILEEGECTP